MFLVLRGTTFICTLYSVFIYPTRGVRRGFTLSPLLYVLTMEVLACNLRVHPDLVGIKIPNSTVSLPVVCHYAGNTSAIVTSDPGIKAAVFDTYTESF